MAIILEKENINTNEYWDKRYETNDWVENNGICQTTFWANLIFNNLKPKVTSEILNEKLFITDIGCALGQLTAVASCRFPDSPILGIDKSQPAIDLAKKYYPHLKFEVSDFEALLTDVGIVSNVLEHDTAYLETIEKHLSNTRKFYIILSPTNEPYDNAIPEHVIVFNDLQNDFPDRINEFNCIQRTILPVRQEGIWDGEMALIVYEKGDLDPEEKPLEIAPQEEQDLDADDILEMTMSMSQTKAIDLKKLILASNFADSMSEAKRLIVQGAVSVNSRKIRDQAHIVKLYAFSKKGEFILNVGQKSIKIKLID